MRHIRRRLLIVVAFLFLLSPIPPTLIASLSVIRYPLNANLALSALRSTLNADRHALSAVFAADMSLQELIDEALVNNPEILSSDARTSAAQYRVPQAKSVPDPMFMFGYQNEGFRRITVGEEPNAQGMFSLSQMFYYPGKRALKGEMASKDAESQKAMSVAVRHRITARVKELYYDLFLAHKNIDIYRDRAALFSRIEDAALARYSSGMGPQQEVVMAQTEKYMLLEKEEMQKQKIQVVEGMLNTTVGRDVKSPLARPAEPPLAPFQASLEDLVGLAYDHSPDVKSREKMIQGAEARVKMAQKEYYPDVTVAAGYFPKTQGLLDMWSLTATVNLPVFSRTKQSQAVLEATSSLTEARRELQATKYMISSAVRETYSMVTTADNLLRLYKEGLIPKTYQDFELAIAGYVAGKVEAITAITRLKSLLDYELLYWGQRVEREKALARLHAVTGTAELGAEVKTR